MATPSNKDGNKYSRISQDSVATINNCLAIISGYSQLLVRQTYIKPDDKRRLQEIVKQVERIVKLLPQAKSK